MMIKRKKRNTIPRKNETRTILTGGVRSTVQKNDINPEKQQFFHSIAPSDRREGMGNGRIRLKLFLRIFQKCNHKPYHAIKLSIG